MSLVRFFTDPPVSVSCGFDQCLQEQSLPELMCIRRYFEQMMTIEDTQGTLSNRVQLMQIDGDNFWEQINGMRADAEQLTALIDREIGRRLLGREARAPNLSIRHPQVVQTYPLPHELWVQVIAPMIGEDFAALEAVAQTSSGGLAAEARRTLRNHWEDMCASPILAPWVEEMQRRYPDGAPAFWMQCLAQEMGEIAAIIEGFTPESLKDQGQLIQDKNLQRLFGARSRLQIQPLRRAGAEQIREWIGKSKAFLETITELDLRNLDLTFLPSEIAAFPNLRRLLLSGNHLKWLPREIAKLTQLEVLDISNLNLDHLPHEILSLRQLSVLDCSRNKIRKLPLRIDRLERLKVLELAGNCLKELPKTLGRCLSLEILDVRRNRLRSLPTEIGALSKLQKLKLSDNRITEIPTTIGALRNLTEVNLSRNHLATLPVEIGFLQRLEVLALSGISGIVLSQGFSHLSGLQTLHLDECGLQEIPEEIIALEGLHTLNFSDNSLSEFPNSLGVMANLRTLRLQKNKIESVVFDQGTFINLQRVSLEGNPLKHDVIGAQYLFQLEEIFGEVQQDQDGEPRRMEIFGYGGRRRAPDRYEPVPRRARRNLSGIFNSGAGPS